MDKYILQRSDTQPLWWVLTDTENQIVCRFKEGEFNETQKFTPLDDASEYDVSKLPSIAADMSQWLSDNHYEIVFNTPTTAKEATRKVIGEQLREIREMQGYSLRELAKITGIAHNHIGRIEQGKYNVTLDTLAVICDALDVSLGIY